MPGPPSLWERRPCIGAIDGARMASPSFRTRPRASPRSVVKPKSAETRRHGSFLCGRSRAVAMTQGPVVIVGAGHAGFQAAASLRQLGFAEPVHLINDEGHQ